MHSIRELLQLSTDFLKKKEITAPKLCAEELLAFVLNKKRLDLFLDYDAPVEEREVGRYRSLIKRKSEGEPLGYLLETAEFLDCVLAVSPAVLVPRQETEILVSMALKEIPNKPKVLWDLCSGSGCMGIAAKKHRPLLNVTLADLSFEALECAKANAKQNEVDVTCVQGDLLAPFEGQKADFIFCNPPYVAEEDYPKLEKEVHFEPRQAHIAKERGLEFYLRLAAELPPFLASGAKIFLEIGHNQGTQVLEIFHQSHWKQKRCEKDWAGNDRFFFLEFSHELP
ncbi:MAG: peptide chain release factor N(5)-glutamine methyltransferase [Simkania sp.]|nr:peptide chain release factor N(5)-glutamine methyltransferase [Simkania sp.]MCP5489970.1 peptide chain release factor N(5)-glutamine methyltransferase [Chlamydiales bacterium]